MREGVREKRSEGVRKRGRDGESEAGSKNHVQELNLYWTVFSHTYKL